MYLIPLYALLNCLRGRGFVKHGRIIFLVLMGLVAGWQTGQWAICMAGLMLWGVWGWGRGFQAFHGRYDGKPCIRWIDAISEAVFPPDLGHSRMRGILWMSIRGGFLYPMFIFLHHPLIGLLSFSQGLCYGLMRYVPEKYAVMYAELLFGAVIGLMIYVSL